MKKSPKLTPETPCWFHEFVPTGSTSKPIVFSDPGNQVIEIIKNTKQEGVGLHTVLTSIKNHGKINLTK